jgi:hypothetical protein
LALSVIFVGYFASEKFEIVSIDRLRVGETALLAVPGDRETLNVLLLALVGYGLLFIVGAIFNRYREYTLSASYLGVVIALPIALFAALGTGSPGALSVSAILALLISITFIGELILKTQIARILEQPR